MADLITAYLLAGMAVTIMEVIETNKHLKIYNAYKIGSINLTETLLGLIFFTVTTTLLWPLEAFIYINERIQQGITKQKPKSKNL
jgi:hypothetical protein